MKNPVKYFSIIIRNDYGGKANSLAPGVLQTTKQAVHFFAIAALLHSLLCCDDEDFAVVVVMRLCRKEGLIYSGGLQPFVAHPTVI